MRKLYLARLAAPAIVAFLVGCGSAGSNNFEAANRLTVTDITSDTGAYVVESNAVEKTDDSGADGIAGTNDLGENNGFPDEGEAVLEPLADDLGTISFNNEPRGVKGSGVDLSVYRVDISYRDAANNSHPDFAPTKAYSVTLNVPSEGTADLVDVILVPVEMKYGVREFFLYDPAGLPAVRNWTAIVDVYARDLKNDDDVHTQARFSIHFHNPMVEEL